MKIIKSLTLLMVAKLVGAMTADFPLLFKEIRSEHNKIKSIIIGGFVVLCMIALQLFGIVHEVNHDTYLKTSSPYSDVIGQDSSFSHSTSKDCQLFDGLALSGFVASALFILALSNNFPTEHPRQQVTLTTGPLSLPYSSRAPPKF